MTWTPFDKIRDCVLHYISSLLSTKDWGMLQRRVDCQDSKNQGCFEAKGPAKELKWIPHTSISDLQKAHPENHSIDFAETFGFSMRINTWENRHLLISLAMLLEFNEQRGFPGMFDCILGLYALWLEELPCCMAGTVHQQRREQINCALGYCWSWTLDLACIFGLPGDNNNLNVLDRSTICCMIITKMLITQWMTKGTTGPIYWLMGSIINGRALSLPFTCPSQRKNDLLQSVN